MSAATFGTAGAAETTRRLTLGVARHFVQLGCGTLTEFPLANGRRVDVIAVDGRSHITVVEVKSSPADFRADRKWRDYLEFGDAFYFAVAPEFPIELLPDDCGLIVADRWDAEIVRPSPETALPGARRKAMLLRFALAASGRLHRFLDPVL